MTYPAAISSFTTKIDGTNDVMAADVNGLQADVVALETELGTDPAGTVATVKDRLAQSLAGDGNLDFEPYTSVLTIIAGVITPIQNYQSVTTEGAAATDDLDTITDVADGFVLVIHPNADNRQIRIRHAADNIACANGQDIYLRKKSDLCLLLQEDTLGVWCALAFSPAGNVRASAAITTTATLNSGHNVVRADATAAAFTITLPAVAGCLDWEYTIIKTDDSANAVTLDGASAETINWALTLALSTQGSKATLHCDATQWLIIG